MCLSSDRATRRRRVSNFYPRSIFNSSIPPSALSLSMEIRSLRGISSLEEMGRPTTWMASGTAALVRGRMTGSSREMVVVSLM